MQDTSSKIEIQGVSGNAGERPEERSTDGGSVLEYWAFPSFLFVCALFNKLAFDLVVQLGWYIIPSCNQFGYKKGWAW